MAKSMGVRFLASVPLDPAVVAAADEGRPLEAAAEGSPFAEAFAEVVRGISEALEDDGVSAGDKAEVTMRIAVPISGHQVSAHFGHADRFDFLDIAAEGRQIVARESETAPPHQPGLLPRWLKEHGADVVLAGGMGQRAVSLLADQGIRVVTGVAGMTAEDAVKAYVSGTLEVGGNICDH